MEQLSAALANIGFERDEWLEKKEDSEKPPLDGESD
jgi:hypothetical protein